MKKLLKVLGLILVLLLLIALVVPLVIPLPSPGGVSGIAQVTDADSQFVKINKLNVHYKQAGNGPTNLILLHGFGASTFSWREVIQPLGKLARVIAYDRPAFGLTDRPMPGDWNGSSPYGMDAQVALLVGLMDAVGMDKAILVGNSAGGAVALTTALRYPQRVQALILVDAAVYSGGGSPQWLKPLLATPQGRWYGPLLVRRIQESGMTILYTAWHDPSRITPAIIAGYRKPLQVPNWDRALWEFTIAQQPADLANHLVELKLPVLVITGDNDRVVPTEQSLRLAREIPGASLALIQFCGHVPQEECPGKFLPAVTDFIRSLK